MLLEKLTDRAFVTWVAREYAVVVCLSYIMVTLSFLLLFSTPMPEALSPLILLQVICACAAVVFAITGFICAISHWINPPSRNETEDANPGNAFVTSAKMKGVLDVV
jgi:fatty-acid desaturase